MQLFSPFKLYVSQTLNNSNENQIRLKFHECAKVDEIA